MKKIFTLSLLGILILSACKKEEFGSICDSVNLLEAPAPSYRSPLIYSDNDYQFPRALFSTPYGLIIPISTNAEDSIMCIDPLTGNRNWGIPWPESAGNYKNIKLNESNHLIYGAQYYISFEPELFTIESINRSATIQYKTE